MAAPLLLAGLLVLSLAVTPALEGQIVDCPIPAPGSQTSSSHATSFFDVFGVGPFDAALQGDVTISHGAMDANGTIPIEILSMSLTGTTPTGAPIVLRESPTRASSGRAQNVQCLPGPTGEPVAHVDSFFDVFVELSVDGGKTFPYSNPVAIQMVSPRLKPVPLDHKLPGVALDQVNQQVPLVNQQGQAVGTISNTRHELEPPPPPSEICFPHAGRDIMDSTLLHDIDIPGIGLCQANLAGPVVVERSEPYVNAATGLMCIDTKIVGLNLSGVDPVCGSIVITLNPLKPSTGLICEKVAGTCFPANSCFEVYIKVELKDLGICLYACAPARMCCMIDSIPPFGCLYNLNIGAGTGPIPLYRGPCDITAATDPCALIPLPPPAAFIIKAIHQPLPPKECTCFPKAGEDSLVTTLAHQIVLPGFNISCSSFTGPMVVRRGDPYLDDQGRCCIKTEIVYLEMKGTCNDGTPAVIRLCPIRRSIGRICAKQVGPCFPAQSCFEVFFEIEVQMAAGPMKFKNCKPAIMCCMIDAIPPLGCPYALQNGPIELYKVQPGTISPCFQTPLPAPDGILQEANHTPNGENPPCCPEYGPSKHVLKTQLLHDIDIPGIGLCQANLSGPVTVSTGTPYVDPATGACCVETLMSNLLLEGVDPVCGRIRVTLDPRHPSKGRICSKQRTACFPATSCFEVWVRIELPDLGMTLIGCEPARMCCEISAIPPYDCLYQLDVGTLGRVPLYLESTSLAGGGGGIPPNCQVVDDGSGTARLPPDGCPYLTADQVHMIVDGLPAGTTIELAPIHKDFICNRQQEACPGLPIDCSGTSGGGLGGEKEVFCSTLELPMQGTGTLSTFNRTISLHMSCETHIAPRTRGQPVQSFDTDMFQMQGQITGDPDFDLLRITGGTGFGMPSPGHTTLTQVPGGNWAVDSFFDITYRIDFVGAPGGPLAGRSGSTTATIRMQAGGGGGQPQDPCAQVPPPDPRAFIVKAVHIPSPPCDCFPPAGDDVMQSELAHRIRIFGAGPGGADIVCDADMTGPMRVRRSDPYIDPLTGLCCIDTEIVAMELRGTDPVCGAILIRESPTKRSLGKICQMPGMEGCFPAASFFDVFVDLEGSGLALSNCSPTRMECKINTIPPFDCVYELNLTGVPLYRTAECAQLAQVPRPNNIQPTGVIEAAAHVPTPCGPTTITCVRQADGSIAITVASDPACPCEGQIVVTRSVDGGPETAITGAVDPNPCATLPPGPHTITYCAICVRSDGTTSKRVCCTVTVDCPKPDCGPTGIKCERQADGSIGLTVVNDPACPCDGIIVVTKSVDGGAEVPLPAGAVSDPDPCVGLSGGPHVITYCARCVRSDGTSSTPVCCEVTVNCPPPVDDCIRDVRCTVVNGRVILVLDLLPNCQCEKYLVTLNGAVITTAVPVAGANQIDAGPCLPGEYCVECVKTDGTLGPKHCCTVPATACPPPPPCEIKSVTCVCTPEGITISWELNGPDPCACSSIIITDGTGRRLASAAPGATSVTLPGRCEEILGATTGKLCVVCVAPDDRNTVACCEIDCADCRPPCDPKCETAGCCEPTGCNGVRVCTVLPPDQLQFDVYITLRSFCKTVLLKECQAKFSLGGNPGGEFWTLQDKCRALVRAIRNDPDCQAKGYRVIDEDCDQNPPCFTVIDATCPGARVVMGISNDPDIFDQETTQGALPDYEAEIIKPLCDPTPNDPPSGDEPGAVVGFAGVASGRKIVEEMRTATAGVLVLQGGNLMRAEVETLPMMPADEIAMMLAMKLREMGVEVAQTGGHLLFMLGPSPGMGAGAGVVPSGGVAGFTNDDGLFVGNFGGPEENLPEPSGALFNRGDADGNGTMELTDAVRILNFLFLGTGVLNCRDAADADDRGSLELTDAVRVLNFLFLGTGTIPAPGPFSASGPCGPDPTEDPLDCVEYTKC